MGFYKQREEFLQALCEAHPLVKHNQPVSDDDESPRYSFFRINDEEELEEACINWIHFPCVVNMDLSGRDVSKDGSVRQRNENIWLFLTKVELDPNNPVFAPALTNAYDLTLSVLMDFKQWIADEYAKNGGCGVFRYLDDAFGRWERYGPTKNKLYGYIFNFADETKPGTTASYNPPQFSQARKIFPFTNVNELVIDYTPELRSRFGDYPDVAVWLSNPETGKYYKNTTAEIIADVAPPYLTTITVNPGADSIGFVSLSAG